MSMTGNTDSLSNVGGTLNYFVPISGGIISTSSVGPVGPTGPFYPYGLNTFGATLYGAPPAFTGMWSASLQATPRGYGQIQLSWIPPSNTGQTAYSELRLVRSSSGYPSTVYEGVTLVDNTNSTGFTNSYTDAQLRPGRRYYYTLFVFSIALGQWVNVGQTQNITVDSSYNSGPWMVDMLPGFYFERDQDLATNAQPVGPLQRFLNLLGWELDWVRTEIGAVAGINNIDLIDADLLTMLATTYGVGAEPTLGTVLLRRLLKNATHLYKSKGTTPGVAAAASAYTGFGCEATVGANMMAQLDDAAFDSSAGVWNRYTNGCQVAPVTFATPQHAAYQPNPNNNSKVLQITSLTGGTISLSTASFQDATAWGYPITAGTSYVFYVWLQGVTASRQAQVQITWTDTRGNLLGAPAQGAAISDTTAGWTQFEVTGQAPPNAVFAFATVTIFGTVAGGVTLMDAAMFHQGTAPLPWDPPRDVKLNLFPTRQNLALNPSFEGDAANWSATNAALANTRGNASAPTSYPQGTAGLQVTATAAGPVTVLGAARGAVPNAPYVFSLYFAAGANKVPFNPLLQFNLTGGGSTIIHGVPPYGTPLTAPLTAGQLNVAALAVQPLQRPVVAGDSILIGSGAAQQVVTAVAPGAPLGATSIPVSPFTSTYAQPVGTRVYDQANAIPGNAWLRLFVFGTAPPNAATVQPGFTYTEAAVGGQQFADAALLEQSSFVRDYFDGSFFPQNDYAWEGSPNESLSDFYPAKSMRLTRLAAVLPDFMPLGGTFTIVTGPQAFANTGVAD